MIDHPPPHHPTRVYLFSFDLEPLFLPNRSCSLACLKWYGNHFTTDNLWGCPRYEVFGCYAYLKSQGDLRISSLRGFMCCHAIGSSFFPALKSLGKKLWLCWIVCGDCYSKLLYIFHECPLFLQMLDYPSRININFILFPLFVCSYINHGCFVSITHIFKVTLTPRQRRRNVVNIELLCGVWIFVYCISFLALCFSISTERPHDRSPPGHSCEFRWNRMANPKAKLILWYQCIARFTSSSHF